MPCQDQVRPMFLPAAKRAALYAAMLAGAAALFLFIDHLGQDLGSPLTADIPSGPGTRPDALLHVLIALVAVLATGRLLGVLLRALGQPPVLGEVVGGIVLGPSLLGQLWPEAAAFVLPPALAPTLGAIAQLGVILYLFLVGLELNHAVLRERVHATVAISHASIVAPFVLGAALALLLYPSLAGPAASFTSFALFMGVALSITAFPVLARILTDRGLQRTRLGIIALGCAAIDDVTAWCLLAFVVSVARARLGGAFLVLGLTAAYIVLMLLVVRPLLTHWLARYETAPVSQNFVAFVLAALLLSALATEALGIHALFGAFLLGALIPHDSAVARDLARKMHDLVVLLLLPAFFAFTGLRTEIALVAGPGAWLLCGLILLAATLGKFGGTLAAARATGLSWRDSTALGLLLNTRGLMELIVLNVGLDLRVLSPTLFAMLVLMALATTFATTPLLHWLIPTLPDEPEA